MKPTTNQIINRVFAAVCGFQIVKGGGGYNSLKGACIRGFYALSAAIFSATIRKIIIAAVFFAAGLSNISANAQSYGYYLVDNNGSSGFNNLFSATGYPSAELAEDGAVQNCVDSGAGSDNDCRTFYVGNRGVFGGTETNQVIVWSQETMLGLNFVGLGVDFAAAYADLFAKCITSRGATDCADTAYAEENVLSCGTGTAEDLTDDCGERFTPTLNCNFGTTTGVDGDGDGNCDCAFDTQIQVDTENCRAAESLEECMDEGFMYFDTITGECTDTDPAPTCTDNARLNEARTSCECDPAFPILVQIDGRNVFSCRARMNEDCTGATPDLFNGVCVAACESDEARNAAGNCVPNPANCEANAITNPDDDMNCVCIDDMHRFVEGSMKACEPIPAMCGANAINDPDDNTMCVCENTETHQFVDGSTTICELISEDNMEETEMENEMEESQNQQTQPQNNGSGRPKEFAYIGAGVFIVGFAASYIAGGGFPIFTYSPDFGYSLTESGYYANVGGRADFRKDKWHFYYSANQQNANGNFADFRYTSGGKYTADFWTATFSESVSGETADYNFALSANLQNGIWKISPVYRMHSEYADNEFDTQNSLNLQSEFRYNNWQIRPSAGFQWQKFSDFANSGRFQINAIHRF